MSDVNNYASQEIETLKISMIALGELYARFKAAHEAITIASEDINQRTKTKHAEKELFTAYAAFLGSAMKLKQTIESKGESDVSQLQLDVVNTLAKEYNVPMKEIMQDVKKLKEKRELELQEMQQTSNRLNSQYSHILRSSDGEQQTRKR